MHCKWQNCEVSSNINKQKKQNNNNKNNNEEQVTRQNRNLFWHKWKKIVTVHSLFSPLQHTLRALPGFLMAARLDS